MEKTTLLEVQNLNVVFPKKHKLHTVLEGVSFALKEGEILGIVGESGSGKSMTALSVMGLLSKEARVLDGKILFHGNDILQMSEKEKRMLKGNEMSMIFQEPMTSLNPVLKIGEQVEEMLRLHNFEGRESEVGSILLTTAQVTKEKLTKRVSGGSTTQKEKWRRKTLQALERVGLTHPEEIYDKYPHQLSGGMRQRVMIAIAMVCEPKLLIADEPTTALDVTVQAQILKLIKQLNNEHGTAVIFISHDLGVVKHLCSRALVMEQGKVIECGTMEELFHSPKEAYTGKLLEAVPSKEKQLNLAERKGNPQKEIILRVENLNAYYQDKQRGVFWGKGRQQVLHDINFTLHKGEILGIVGESGCGKSTLAKTIVGLTEEFDGQIQKNELHPQMVFQDPYGSLNPAKKVGWILEEPLKIHGGYSKKERKEKVLEMLLQVGLEEKHADRYVSQLSGGQRQRVGIACAIMLNTKLIILDEPVSALDVTVQLQIRKLLLSLREKYNLSYLFISHDLNMIYQMCDRVCVMYQGKIVETAEVDELYEHPKHEYTKTLLESIPKW